MSRTSLKPSVSKLREAILKGIAGKLEKYGFDENGVVVTEKPLSEYDEEIRKSVVAFFEAENVNDKDLYVEYIHSTARTFLHILTCFKLMEKRGIMSSLLGKIIDKDIYNEIIPDFASINPLAFDEFSEKYRNEITELMEKDSYEEPEEYYQFLYLFALLTDSMAQEMPLLFKDYEHNLVQPDYDDLKIILKLIGEIDDSEYAEDDFLGWIYQYWVDTEDFELKEAENNKSISFANQIYFEVLNALDKEQTEFGEFYTPRWVVKHIVDKCISMYLQNEESDIADIKILDPACGAGNFLVYAFDCLLQIYDKKHADWTVEKRVSNILENNIFGVDVQREPLQITALNLWIKAKSYALSNKVDRLNLYNVNILMANSLYDWEKEEEYYQISIFDTPETIDKKRFSSEDIGRLISSRNQSNRNNAIRFFKQKFDVIIMNPPFVDARKMNDETLNLLKEKYPQNARNLFSAFIERAISLLKKDACLGFISSDTFFSIISFKQIRENILNNRIVEVDLLGDGIFDGPTVSSAILFLKKQSGRNNEITVNKYDGKEIVPCEVLKQEKLKKIEGYPFIFEVTDSFRKIFGEKTIGDYDFFDVRKGVVTAGNDKYLKYRWEVPENEIGKSFVLYNKEHDAYVDDVKFVLDWRIDTRSKILSNSSARCAYIIDNYDENNEKYNFKLGVAYKLVGNFRSCILNRDSAFDVGTPAILMENDLYQRYMVALMNSKLYIYLAHLLNPTVNNTPGDVRRLPVVFPDQTRLEKINGLVDEIVDILRLSSRYTVSSKYYVCSEIEMGLQEGKKTIKEAYEWYEAQVTTWNERLEVLQDELNNHVYEVFDLSKLDIDFLEKNVKDLYNPVQLPVSSIQQIALRFIRSIFRTESNGKGRLYTVDDVVKMIELHLESIPFDITAHMVKEEIEDILGNTLDEVIKGNIKINNQKSALAGDGMKDEKEPFIASMVIGGKGKGKELILWNSLDFKTEFYDDKKYAMQNEIRRLTDEVYMPRLMADKSRLVNQGLSSADQKKIEKNIELYEACVKTLENWRVVD